MGTSDRPPARLRWPGADDLDGATRAALLGPGGPFELVEEDVLGAPTQVFARRPPHLPAVLDAAVARHGDRPFLVTADRRWTFAEVRRSADAVADVLALRYGVGPGDRVAIAAANAPEYVLAAWATLRLGAVVTGLNGWWAAPELEHGLHLARPTVLLGDERRLQRLAGSAATDGLPVERLADLVSDAEAGAAAGDGAEGGRARALRPPVAIAEDDPAVILFTSGTTGRPKGATLSHRNLVHFGMVSALNGALGQARAGTGGAAPPGAPAQGATLAASPMFHVSGLLSFVMSGPVFGLKLVFLPPGRWDEAAHLRLTEEHGISSWSGVPTQYWRLLDHPDLARRDVSSVRTVGSGGAPYPPDLVRHLRRALPGVTISDGFGMSETAGLATLATGDMIEACPGTVGPAQPTCEIEVRDPLGRPLPEGEVGEICVRNASVFLGYWDDDEATAAVVDTGPDGRWYRTGDHGRIEGGVLCLQSRRRDMILRGGENVYPIEIEHRLVDHPDIADAAVIGVPHPVLGQEVKAFVVPRPGATPTPAEVQRWVAAGLAGFKVPAQVELRASLPYTDTGKVLKQQLER
ncbi:MAG TPA: class I adenylate-forming enzyme family protein, partial [Acidimicrobiales bacterium]